MIKTSVVVFVIATIQKRGDTDFSNCDNKRNNNKIFGHLVFEFSSQRDVTKRAYVRVYKLSTNREKNIL